MGRGRGRGSTQEWSEGVIRAAIAERVGVTQPYLFRLFPDEKAIFVAALVRSAEDTRVAFETATDGVEDVERARQVMADAYTQLISTRPETLMMQLEGYAAAAQGDDLISEAVRAVWLSIWETVHLALDADAEPTASFFACGMLGNTLTAIGLPMTTG